jgi:hypothetical protein
MTLDELVDWFVDHLDSPPARMHQRGVWHDEAASSRLGSPAWDAGFAHWLLASPTSTMIAELETTCLHTEGRPCRSCSVFLDNGEVWETGIRKRVSLRYRWPMRLAMHRVARMPVRPGRPPLDATLLALQHSEGDLGRASTTLSLRYPIMVNPTFAHGFFTYALRRAHRVYLEDVPIFERGPVSHRSRQRSDAQLDAEAAGRVDSAERSQTMTAARS